MRPDRYAYRYASGGGNRSLKSRAVVAVLLTLAVALLVLARAKSPVVDRLRTGLDGVVAPTLKVVNAPVRGAEKIVEDKTSLLTAYRDNQRLREENETLRHWQAVARALKAENDNLRKLADYRPSENVTYVTAQVIAQSPEAYSGTLMLNAGLAQGLASLAPVIDSDGLIGRLVDVGENTSRVLLLTDSRSRIPVITANTRQHAILAGTGDELMRMTFVGGDSSRIELGEPIMTTSEGGLIPESVMVGTVFRRDASGLLVKPIRPLARAEYVRIMIAAP
jgi:rod shape-determining protein MreC